jgi:hypothetical protein
MWLESTKKGFRSYGTIKGSGGEESDIGVKEIDLISVGTESI